MASLETLRFVLVGEDRASSSFQRLGRAIDETTGKLDVSNLALKGTAEKIDEIRRKADELGRLNPKLKPEIDATAFKLQLALLRRDIKSTLNQSNTGGGFFSNLAGGLKDILGTTGGAAGAGGSGILGITATLPLIGTLGVPALAALAAAAVLLGAALAPVAAALIPITAGLAGFTAIAIPEISKVFAALSAKGAAAKKALDALTPAERAMLPGIRSLKSEWDKLTKAVQPEVMKVFGAALKVIKDLMPALQPLIIATGKMLDKFLTQLSNWLESPQGQSFINWLRTVGPQDIKNFGRVLWDVAKTVGQALNAIYRAGSWIDRFVTRWHEDWIIVKDFFRVIGDDLVIFALRTVSGILEPFTHIPLIGHKFAEARDAVNRELGRMVVDAKQASNEIQDAWDSIHAHSIPLNFDLNLPTGVHITTHSGGGRKTGHAAGTPAAASGWAWVGEKGPELVNFSGGETVLPSHVSMAMGTPPGYAAGAGYNIHDEFHPTVKAFDKSMTAMAGSAINAIATYVQSHFGVTGGLLGGGISGLGAGPGGPVEAIARRMFPWGASQWPAFNAVEMREAGYNLTAQNPSGAYGVAQFINGPSEYFQWGGSPFSAVGQFAAMFNYIRSRYGTPAGAWQHELGFGWYDQGGYLPPGLSMAYNGTGAPERVLGPGQGGTTVINNVYVNGIITNPRETGRQIAEALNHAAPSGVKLRKSLIGTTG